LRLAGWVAYRPPPAPSAKAAHGSSGYAGAALVVRHFVARRRLPAVKRTATMPGRIGQRKTCQFALLNCTQPVRGKSPAIQHNRAFCKMQPVANRVGLVSAPLRALRVRRRGGYVLRPSPDNSYVSAAVAASAYSGAARKVALIPRPAGLPAAARTALLVPASAAALPSAPR